MIDDAFVPDCKVLHVRPRHRVVPRPPRPPPVPARVGGLEVVLLPRPEAVLARVELAGEVCDVRPYPKGPLPFAQAPLLQRGRREGGQAEEEQQRPRRRRRRPPPSPPLPAAAARLTGRHRRHFVYRRLRLRHLEGAHSGSRLC